MPNWFHFNCFWKKLKYKPTDTALIKGYDNLRFIKKILFPQIVKVLCSRWEDQQKIKTKMGLDIKMDESVENEENSSDKDLFSIEYSKSNRSKCKKCVSRIDKVI